ncbi:hypothetical protein GCM10017750_42240 [Streptomyces racemochromogenes]
MAFLRVGAAGGRATGPPGPTPGAASGLTLGARHIPDPYRPYNAARTPTCRPLPLDRTPLRYDPASDLRQIRG